MINIMKREVLFYPKLGMFISLLDLWKGNLELLRLMILIPFRDW